MKKTVTILMFSLLFSGMSIAQNREVIDLWPEGVPESNGITQPETNDDGRTANVSVPSMTVYQANPSKNTCVAILICPGGGYARLAMTHEGTQFGEWLSENGITAFVLKYRMPNKHPDIPLKDAQQAMRIIRSRAGQWGINPSKIGVSGFSAGGHLASTLGTHFDSGKPAPQTEAPSLSSFSCRPDFLILFYPVISMQEDVTHAGSRENLLGDGYKRDLVNNYSNERQVTKDTPPTLIFLSDDDKAVIPQNSFSFYAALKANNVPASLHIFPEGGHGWGFRNTFRYHEVWKGLYMDWLKHIKMLETPAPESKKH
jgi:acetyl esterase/lipase